MVNNDKRLIPQFFRGLPFLDLNKTPTNFSGNIIIISGYGLGDTVNSLGIQRVFSNIFPKANTIVLVHDNWKVLLDNSLFPYMVYSTFWNKKEIRSFPSPPFPNLLKPMKFFLKKKPNTYIGFGDIEPPDRFALRERHTESVLRIIGIKNLKSIRPFIPLNEKDLEDGRKFLIDHKLEIDKFCVIAPEASSIEREWGRDRFVSLAEALYEKENVKSVFVGQNKDFQKNIPSIIDGFNFSLPMVCAIISMAKFFVGNDSGLCHVAASFDIPVLTINFKKDTISHEVRPLSPYASQIISFENNDLVKPGEMEVFQAVSYLTTQLRHEMNPVCFACSSPMRYIISSDSETLIRMCSCGARKKILYNANHSEFLSEEKISDFLNLPISIKALKDFEAKIKSLNSFGKDITLRVSMDSLCNFKNKKIDGEISWSFDAVLLFFQSHGWFLKKITHETEMENFMIFSLDKRSLSPFSLPVGKKKILFRNSLIYLRYFSFYTWYNNKKLIDIMRSDWYPTEWKNFFWVGYSIFTIEKSIKSFLRWQRIFLCLFFKNGYFIIKTTLNIPRLIGEGF